VSAVRRRPTQTRARDTVARIVGAARDVLATEGAAAFNTNHIARRAGVSVGSLYDYFPNKQAIVRHLIEDLAGEETDAILERFSQLDDATLGQTIDDLVALTYRLYQRNVGVYRVLWAMSTDEREVGTRRGEQMIVRELVRRLQLDGVSDPELTAFTCFHLVESLTARMLEQGEGWDHDTRVREISRVVHRYLGLAEGLE
jgi:AcrR family transcriptional regulator